MVSQPRQLRRIQTGVQQRGGPGEAARKPPGAAHGRRGAHCAIPRQQQRLWSCPEAGPVPTQQHPGWVASRRDAAAACAAAPHRRKKHATRRLLQLPRSCCHCGPSHWLAPVRQLRCPEHPKAPAAARAAARPAKSLPLTAAARPPRAHSARAGVGGVAEWTISHHVPRARVPASPPPAPHAQARTWTPAGRAALTWRCGRGAEHVCRCTNLNGVPQCGACVVSEQHAQRAEGLAASMIARLHGQRAACSGDRQDQRTIWLAGWMTGRGRQVVIDPAVIIVC
eukprot:363687-Chlamydomonas_euryale.AAC.4